VAAPAEVEAAPAPAEEALGEAAPAPAEEARAEQTTGAFYRSRKFNFKYFHYL
jgi:hypothetical protein